MCTCDLRKVRRPAQVTAEIGVAKNELAVMFAVARAREVRGQDGKPVSGDAHIRAAREAHGAQLRFEALSNHSRLTVLPPR